MTAQVQFGMPPSTCFETGSAEAGATVDSYIAIITMDRVATKVAMEANAAISRRRSVIVVSRVRYVSYLFSFRTRVNKRTKWKRNLRDIPVSRVNNVLTRHGSRH
jgi:hypothetical protein